MPDVTIEQALAIALQHHQAGRLSDAEAIYRQILAIAPQHPDALHLLGVLAIQAGRNDIAAELIGKCVAVAPNNAEAYSNLAHALRNLGQVDRAIEAARMAVRLAPPLAAAHLNLGDALASKGQLDDAASAYRTAIEIFPNYAEAYRGLAMALGRQGQFEQAALACETAIRIKPDYVEAYHTLGSARVAMEQIDEAIACFRAILAINPKDARAQNNFGVTLFAKGRIEESIAAYRVAIDLKPDFADAYNNLSNALRETGRPDEAVTAGEMAVRLKPDYFDAYFNLGNALADVGKLDEAIASYETAVRLKPDHAKAYANLGVVLMRRRQFGEATAAYRKATEMQKDRAEAHDHSAAALNEMGRTKEAAAHSQASLKLSADYAGVHGNLILAMLYDEHDDQAAVSAEARRWAQQHEAPVRSAIKRHENDRTPQRRLRIGYVSADWREHPVARFMLPLLSAHARDEFEVFIYSDVTLPDAMMAQIRGYADHWREIAGLHTEQVADLVRQDRIDILVDLAGHTANNRLPVFALKPAPVQVSYLGFPATTGLSSIDYRLTDIYADPPDDAENAKSNYSEELIRLPVTAWCWPTVSDAPACGRDPGPFTFACLANLKKVTEPMLRLWGRIVAAAPGSRLMLKSVSLAAENVRAWALATLREEGVEPDRVEMLWRVVSYAEHMALYRRIDVVLDTFPYHGTTTTCEALSMGVPVISLAGKHHVSRVGVSLLNAVGLTEFLAYSPEAYSAIAQKVANDRSGLETSRVMTRNRMIGSPLMDAERFARDIENAYRQMWKTWCDSPAKWPRDIEKDFPVGGGFFC